MMLVVTDHALAQARRRYGLANIDAQLIYTDVADALLEGRAGKELPFRPNACKGNAIYCWTLRGERAYVVEPQRRGRRRSKHLLVVTAIPGYHADEPWEVAA